MHGLKTFWLWLKCVLSAHHPLHLNFLRFFLTEIVFILKICWMQKPHTANYKNYSMKLYWYLTLFKHFPCVGNKIFPVLLITLYDLTLNLILRLSQGIIKRLKPPEQMWHAEVATGQTKQIFVSGSATTIWQYSS